MTISWDSIRSLVIFFGPILVPKAIAYYRTVRNAPRRQGLTVQPVPPRVRLSLAVLLALCLGYVVLSFPAMGPENLFRQTDSRLQIPVDVLFNRVAATLRSSNGNALTARDHALRAKFVNLESRLLYLRFGPDVLADCPFCTVDEPKTYMYYALPDLTWPHVANLAVLAAATSPGWTSGKRGGGGGWRTPATVAALLLASLDVYLVGTYNHGVNARAPRLADVDMFFWSARVYRLLALAGLDAAVAGLLFLSSTNRAFAPEPQPLDRIDPVYRRLLAVRAKMNALGIVRNTAVRDQDLRSRTHAYWAHEVDLMADIMQDADVVRGVNDALTNRINIDDITRDADVYSRNVLRPLDDDNED
ncbi:Conserved hypothetical, protein [Geosmithia morbida]|uniref:Conserved hypothetical, protein n=1 Tax=Geosmithia morbida TaxID=1094350 RepID=A0A9P4YMZ4_9HYPO|nr:Conserved hypothetical, protein [Geosmithia morbida]KAF4119427.1 Conserved hypothetical, protein [Geosmithia morbida]